MWSNETVGHFFTNILIKILEAAKGRHWDLYETQGIENLWIIGGGTSFESVTNVMGYNQLLIEKMDENISDEKKLYGFGYDPIKLYNSRSYRYTRRHRYG